MQARSLASLLALIALFSTIASAQSGRGTVGGGKAGQRNNARPQPSPTATPAAVEPTPAPETPVVVDDEIIKINTQLVSIPVRVMDKKGRFIGGLTKENFRVFEDNVEQEVALFANEQQPFTVVLMLDMSYSSKFKITDIQSAALAFIAQLRPEDKVMVVSFDEEVHMLSEPTNDRKDIYRAIRSTKIKEGTSVYDAVDQVMNQRLRSIEGRKAIIIFTDGVDTTSRYANDYSNVGDAMELDALIYPIRYDTFADVQQMKNHPTMPLPIPGSPNINPFPVPIPTSGGGQASDKGTTPEEYKRAEEYLDKLANYTGGRTYLASTLDNLATAFSKIASELREFYSLGYYPKQDRVAGRNTTIKVKVDQPNTVVRTRDGYIVPKRTKIKTN
jgi:Ca-activated chloride channel family protein